MAEAHGRPDTPNQDHTATWTEQARHATSSATEYVHDAYEATAAYARDQRERYPAADRYLQEAAGYARTPVRASPLLAIMVAGVIGYGLAYLIHAGGRRDDRDGVPDSARTRTHYRLD